MVTINQEGYLTRITAGSQHKKSEAYNIKNQRNWWLVKHASSGNQGRIEIHNIMLPSEYVGKKVRFKIEVIEE